MSGYRKRDPETFPVGELRRVDRPTTAIQDESVPRVREGDAGFMKARRGVYGPVMQKEVARFVPKHPMSGAESWMMGKMRTLVDGMAAAQKAPIPDDPELLSRHVKEAAYFLRADAVGICKLPPYAVYSHNFDPKNPETGVPVELNHKIRHRYPDRPGLADRRSLYGPRLDKQCHEHALLFQLGVHRHNPRRVYPPPRLSREGPLRVELSGGASAYPSVGRAWARCPGSATASSIPSWDRDSRERSSRPTFPLLPTSPSISACRTSARSVRSAPASVRGAP